MDDMGIRTMKVMAYNILEGGNLSKGDRTELLLQTIHQVSPDILGLCECRGFAEDNSARLQFFKRELRMSGTMNRSQSGNHVALLYKPALNVTLSTPRSIEMYNGYVRVIASVGSIGPIAVVMTHLHPFSSWFRVGEMETLAASAASAPESIIMGDMNNVAPSDLPVDLTGAPATLAERLKGVTGEVDPLPVAVLLNRGFADLGSAKAVPTYPTTLSQERSSQRVRLDYMFASSGLARRCSAFDVKVDEIAQRASDHLPIVAELAL